MAGEVGSRLGVLRFLGVFAFAVVVAATIAGALVWSTLKAGQAALDRSEQAFDDGRLRVSLDEARVAAALVVFGAEHVGRADDRLRAIAFGAEARGDEVLARRAWSALRGAAIERRHPLASEPALDEADRQLARLLVRAHATKKSRAFSEQELLETLRHSRPGQVSPLWSSGVLTPLLGMLAIVLWRRRSPPRRPG
jgi:hypothetical protein